MSLLAKLPLSLEAIENISATNSEPDWMRKLRVQAYNDFVTLDLPAVQKTNIANWNFNNSENHIDDSPENPKIVQNATDSNLILFENNKKTHMHLDQDLKDKGVIFTDLAQAIKSHEALVRKYLLRDNARYPEHKLSAQHKCLTETGVFLYVPANVEIATSLHATFNLSRAGGTMFPHILVATEANSKVDLVVSFMADSKDNCNLNNSMIEAYVAENSFVSISTINNLPKSAVDVTYRRSTVERSGELEWIVNDLSEGKVISNTTSHLVGEGASTSIKSTSLGVDKSRTNITYEMYHWGRHTNSNINARSVVKDNSTSVLNCITKIEKGASKSDGQQSGKVLVLDPEARGDANPILLIDENDVTAGHAASVGNLDPLQLYYLMSRGIPRTKAEKLIIHGFLDAVISEIGSESVKELLYKILARKLN